MEIYLNFAALAGLFVVVLAGGWFFYRIVKVAVEPDAGLSEFNPSDSVIKLSVVLVIVFAFVLIYLASDGEIAENVTTFLASIAAYLLGSANVSEKNNKPSTKQDKATDGAPNPGENTA